MKLYFRQVGQKGESVFLFHGLYGSSFNWNAVAQDLGRLYRVFAFDLRNHGLSPKATFMDYPQMIGDVLQTVGKLDIFPVYIVGHSLGGKLAMALAQTFQDKVKGLVVLDIAPVDYGQELLEMHLRVLKALKGLPLEHIKSRKEAEIFLSKEIDEGGLVRFLLTNLVYESNKYVWRINLEGIENSIEILNSFPHMPVQYFGKSLFVFGEKSPYFHPSFIPRIRFSFPEASAVILRGAGHWIHYERFEEFMELLRLFLGKSENTLYSYQAKSLRTI